MDGNSETALILSRLTLQKIMIHNMTFMQDQQTQHKVCETATRVYELRHVGTPSHPPTDIPCPTDIQDKRPGLVPGLAWTNLHLICSKFLIANWLDVLQFIHLTLN